MSDHGKRGWLDRLEACLPWGAVGIGFLFALRRLDNTDTWWHLASGRWIAEHLSVQRTDVLSFTVPDSAWVNLQWLFDLALYGLFRVGEVPLLVLTSALVYAAAVALLVIMVRRNLGPVPSALLATLAVFLAQPRFAIRPEALSFVLLLAMLWLLRTGRTSDDRRLWLLVPLMALWVNVHALFAIGLFVLGCHVAAALTVDHLPVPEAWRASTSFPPEQRRRLLLAAAASSLATLFNPYTFRGVLFPFELMTRFDDSGVYAVISEFRTPFLELAPNLTIGAFQLYFVLSLAVVLAATVHGAVKSGDGFNLAELAMFVGFAYLAWLARRNMALFAMATAPFLAQCIAQLTASRSVRGSHAGRARQLIGVGCGLALVAIAGLVATSEYYRLDSKSHQTGTGVLEARFPERAVAFFEEVGLPGPLFNDVSTGGYLTWARPTSEGVYVDGRLEVYDEFFETYMNGLRDPAEWAAQVARFGINSVMLYHRHRNRHPLVRWLQRNPAWSLVYYDDVVVIFVRQQGHEPVVNRARTAFVGWEQDTRSRLFGEPRGFGYPRGRVLALTQYAGVLELLGDLRGAAACYEHSLGFRLPQEQELVYSLWLTNFHARDGDRARAREFLDRAASIRPEHPEVSRLQGLVGRD